MDLDFINAYFPEVADIDAATLLATRQRLDAFIKSAYPDLDTRPNSVFGDLALAPYAHLVAGHEMATKRFMSDLDLEAVASGIVYNCDFVRQYLKNFATIDQTTLKSSGVIRLTFCADAEYTIDRRARYTFGAPTNDFTLRLPHAGSLFVLPVGSVVTPKTNEYALKQIAENRYAVDIGVVGAMTEAVLAGDSGETDFPLDDLTAITAVTNFDFGLPPESLAVLAAKTREAFYSATLTTRSGANNFLSREFADLVATSPILPGDTAAVRASINPLGVANGKLDICVQSGNFGTDVSQTIKLTYSSTGAAFYGNLDLIEVPQVIKSITYAGDNTIELGPKGPTGSITVLSRSKDFAKAPLMTSAYSTYEEYWIKIDMPTADAVDLITPVNGSDDTQYAYFTINYAADPMVKVVSDVLASADFTPVGVDVLVKGYTPIVIDTLLITYTKKAGTKVALGTAKDEIYAYFKQLGYNKIYSASKIYDAMFYAGAEDVVSINVSSRVQWTIADKLLTSASPSDPSSYANFENAYTNFSLAVPATVTNNLIATSAFDASTYAVLEARNRGYYLPKENIVFSEVIY